MSSWFDSVSGILNFDETVAKNPHFQKIMADGVVTEEEVAGQARYVVTLLEALYKTLNPQERALVRQVIEEITVLSIVSQYQAVHING